MVDTIRNDSTLNNIDTQNNKKRRTTLCRYIDKKPEDKERETERQRERERETERKKKKRLTNKMGGA